MNLLIQQILEQSIENIVSISKFQSSDLSVIKNPNAKFLIDHCKDTNISILTYQDSNYPKNLIISNGPALIFYKGNIDLINQDSFAIVGSRVMDKYSLALMQNIVPRLKGPVLSGFAIGVDIEAHRLALQYTLPCIAVLPSGLDREVITPKSNKEYIDKILSNNGLIISQFLPNIIPKKYSYILRNELLANLCSSIWIVKAALKSGTITTAQYAFDSDKTIYSTMNNIYDQDYKGNAFVIEKGAIPITTPDIFGPVTSNEPIEQIPNELIEILKNGVNDIEVISENLGYSNYIKLYMELTLQKRIYEEEGRLFLIK
jgi:DNA processing protein